MKDQFFICCICFSAQPCFVMDTRIDDGVISLLPGDGMIFARQHNCKHNEISEVFRLSNPPQKIRGLFGDINGT